MKEELEKKEEQLQKKLEKMCIRDRCDIENPMFGEKGAAYIFGPQKGADTEEIQVLDRNLRAFSEVIKRELGMDVSLSLIHI